MIGWRAPFGDRQGPIENWECHQMESKEQRMGCAFQPVTPINTSASSDYNVTYDVADHLQDAFRI